MRYRIRLLDSLNLVEDERVVEYHELIDQLRFVDWHAMTPGACVEVTAVDDDG